MKIRTKLLILLISLSLIPIGIGGLFSLWDSEEHLKKQIGENSLELARLMLRRVSEHFYAEIEDLRRFTLSDALDDTPSGDRDGRVKRFVCDLAEQDEGYRYAICLDVNGKAVASSTDGLAKEEFFEDSGFQKALENQSSIQGPFPDVETGVTDLILTIPIKREGAGIIGVLRVSHEWDSVRESLLSMKIHGREQDVANHIMLVNKQGLTISCYDKKEMFRSRVAEEGLFSYRNAGEEKEGYLLETSEHGLPSFSAYTYTKPREGMPSLRWRLILNQDPEIALASVRSLARRFVVLMIALAGLACVVSIVLCRLIINRILSVSTAAEAVGNNDFTQVVPVQADDEIGTLATSFNMMTGKLRQSMEELIKEKNKLMAVVNATQCGFTIQDRDYNIIFQNDHLKNTFGERTGEKCYRVYEGKEDVCEGCPVEMAFADGKHHKSIRNVEMPSGETGIWDNSAYPIRDANGEITSCLELAKEITEERHQEERYHQAEKMAAIGELAGGIAHDFNNQLTCISGYAQILLKRLDDEDLRTCAENIYSSAKSSADLTTQLLTFSRKGNNVCEPVDLHKVINEVMGLLQHSADKRIKVKHHMDASASTTTGDSTQLQNALLNLALNACDAMPKSGELVFSTKTVKLDEDYCRKQVFDVAPGKYIRLSVRDSGVGMNPEVRKRIFEPFFTTKKIGEGTGMGLAAVYGTVKLHHGCITVESEPGRGSLFSLYFPMTESFAQEKTVCEERAASNGTARILLVDDEERVRNLTAGLLKEMNHKVTTSKDGVDAVDQYRKSWEHIDLVILDMAMPRMNGRDAFLAMREINPDIKVLVSSGFSKEIEMQRMLSEGALGFLRKPYGIDELYHKVDEVLFCRNGRAQE